MFFRLPGPSEASLFYEITFSRRPVREERESGHKPCNYAAARRDLLHFKLELKPKH